MSSKTDTQHMLETGAVLIIIVVYSFVLFWWGYYDGRSDLKLEIVKHGAAEYYIDKDGKPQWQWKAQPVKE